MKFLKGLFRDNNPLVQPQGTYRKMLNGSLSAEKGAVSVERGDTESALLPEGLAPVGKIGLADGRVILFFRSEERSVIGYFNGESYVTLLDDASFAEGNRMLFGEYIEGEYRVNSNQQVVIYWTDNVNVPRYLNLNTVPVGEFDISNLSLFPLIHDIPNFSLTSINDVGGRLRSGAYQIALAYVDEDNTATNYFFVSNPIMITDSTDVENNFNYDGCPPATPTSKSITFDLANLDVNFKYLRVAIIRMMEHEQREVHVLPDVSLNGVTLNYTYTGFEQYLPGNAE
jgi:hypothetical protein